MAFNEQFIEACKTGNLDSVREIYMLNPTIDISTNGEEAFIEACKEEHLTVVRQLYEWKPTIDISFCVEDVFTKTCENGHLEVVRQLYEGKPTIDISSLDEWAFRRACEKEHLEIVRQLYEGKSTIDLSKCYQYRTLLLSIGISLPNTLTKEFIAEGETLECPICMDIIQSEYLVTKCGHKYCGKCINQWLENNSLCPYCRAPI